MLPKRLACRDCVASSTRHSNSRHKIPRVCSLDRLSSTSTHYDNTGSISINVSNDDKNESNHTGNINDCSKNVIPPFIPVRNEYETLSGDAIDAVPAEVELAEKTSRIRLPPIYIMDMPVGNVFKLLTDCGIPRSNDFLLKNTKKSVQFLSKSRVVFDKTVSVLKKMDVKFFTHNTPEKIPIKFVLSGLPLMEISEVKQELRQSNILPRDIKILSTTKAANNQHALYLLYFDRGSTKIQDLRKTKALFNLVVSWRFFSKRPNDAVQCHRCQSFGHGSTNCNLQPKCVKCSGKHLTAVCALPKKEDLTSMNDNKLHIKCANCAGNHTANFRGCPARKTYLGELEKRKKTPIRPSIHMTNASFPNLTDQGISISRSPPTRTDRVSYAQVTSINMAHTPNDEHPGEGLFTISEFLSLARDMFIRLNGCRTKQQQFLALSELMMKYLYHG